MTPHSNTRGAPPKKPKKCRFRPIRHCFQPHGWGTAVFKINARGDFWKFCVRTEIQRRFCGPLKDNKKNRSVFRGRIWELVGKNLPPNNFSAFSRLRIQRRLWLCYQTWPNSIRWLSYGFLWHAQIVLSPQNKDHTLCNHLTTFSRYFHDIFTISSQLASFQSFVSRVVICAA